MQEIDVRIHVPQSKHQSTILNYYTAFIHPSSFSIHMATLRIHVHANASQLLSHAASAHVIMTVTHDTVYQMSGEHSHGSGM